VTTRDLSKLRSDRRGDAYIEYLVVLGALSLAMVGGLLIAGPILMSQYQWTQKVIAAPFP
jgi:hypothetical protein